MKNICITTTSFANFSKKPLQLLEEEGLQVKINTKGRKLLYEEVVNFLKKSDAVIAGTEIYNKEILSQLPKLKIISRLGVGLDNIDINQAKKVNIQIYKTQTTPAQSVAELTLGLILNILKKISLHSFELKSGLWNKKMGRLLSGKTLGILGLGTIGKKMVEVTSGFDLEYIAYDIYENKPFAKTHDIKYVDFDELLQRSDIISIHLNLTSKTHHLINYNAFKKMKSNALLINTSRGEIIDERSLVMALDEGLIEGAGLDVFENEPYRGPLLNYNNVIVTPHIGAYAKEIRMQMELEAAQNLIRGLKNE